MDTAEVEDVERIVEEKLIARLREGPDPAAADDLLRLLYGDLRRVAHAKLARQRFTSTLRTTALVHEAYLKLFSNGRVECKDTTHFLARAATAMRSILVDHARKKNRLRRQPNGKEVPLEAVHDVFEEKFGNLVELDEALHRLERADPRAARVVELRFFVDCSVTETASVLRQSRRTVERDWTFARAFLRNALA